MAAKGLYFCLKDTSVPLADRLKVARFAWVSDTVLLPNKHQVLLDLVTGFLVNRKKVRLSDGDCEEVWDCLEWILHAPLPAKDPPLLKPSFCQVVLDALHTCLNEVGVSCQVIASCCSAVLATPTLADTFTLRFDFLAHLLSLLSQLGVRELQQQQQQQQQEEEEEEEGGCWLALADVILQVADALSKCQRSQSNLKQVLQTTLEQLLVPLLALRHLASQTPPAPHTPPTPQSPLLARLDSILTSTLLSKDQTPYYKAYLQAAALVAEEGEEQQPGSSSTSSSSSSTSSKGAKAGKLTETFFQTLTGLLHGKSPAKFAASLSAVPWRPAAQSFLLLFYRDFAAAVSQDAVLCHKMLVMLSQMLGLVATETAGDGAGCHGDEGCLATLQGMLEVVRRQELYSVADDNASGFKQLYFFRTLVGTLLKFPRGTPGQAGCLLELLRLNHAILEAKMAALLQLAWLLPDEQEDARPMAGAEELLVELVATYTKLRQLPKLTTFLLTAVQQSSGHSRSAHTPHFYSRYGEAISQLPQASCLDMWQCFLEHLASLSLPQCQSESAGVSKLWTVCGLFEKLLQNLRVTSDALTGSSAARVAELMESTDSAVLRPLFQAALESKEDELLLSACLLLAYCWGELRIMLALHGAGRAGLAPQSALVSHPTDLSLVLPLLSSKQWSRLHKRLAKSENRRLHFLWDLLSMQKMKAAKLFIADRSAREATLANMAEQALQLPEVEKADSLTSVVWDGLVSSVDEERYLVCRWWLLTSHWGHLSALASPAHLASIAHLAVCSLAPTPTSSAADTARLGGKCDTETDASVTCPGVTCASVTRRFLASTALEGGQPLFSTLVSALWHRVAMETFPATSPGKKLKRSGTAALLHQTWSLLACREGGGSGPDGEADRQPGAGLEEAGLEEAGLEEAGTAVTQLLEVWPLTDIAVPDSVLQSTLQVLSSLHYESLGRPDQLRCTLGLLAAVAALTSDLERGGAVVVGGVTRLGELVWGAGRAPLFHYLPPTPLLTWCLRLLEQVSNLGSPTDLGERVWSLVQAVCQALTWHPQALRLALPFVQQLSRQVTPATPGKKRRRTRTREEEDGEAGGLQRETPRLVLTSCLLLQLHKSLCRAYLPDGAREECQKLYQTLSEPVALTLGALSSQGSELLPPSAVTCAQTLLQRRCHAATAGSKSATAETETEEVPDFLAAVLELVLRQLEMLSESGVDRISREEHRGTMACLRFLQAVCQARAVLPSVLPPQSLHRCWSVCRSLLSRLLQSQTSLPETLDLQLLSQPGLQAEVLELRAGVEKAGGDGILGNGDVSSGAGKIGVGKSRSPQKRRTARGEAMEVDGETGVVDGKNLLNGHGLTSLNHLESRTNSSLPSSTADADASLSEGVFRRSGNVVLTLLQEQVVAFGKPSPRARTVPHSQTARKSSAKAPTCSPPVDSEGRAGHTQRPAQHREDAAGSLGGERQGELLECLQATLVDVLCACSPEQFQSILVSLQRSLTVASAGQCPAGLLSSLQLWRRLAEVSLPDSLAPLRAAAAKSMMREELPMLGLCVWRLGGEAALPLLLPLLHLQASLLSRGKALLRGHSALLSLCTLGVLPPLEGWGGYPGVVALCSAVYAVLNALLVQHPTPTLTCLPAFLAALHKLMQAVVEYGSQERLATQPAFTDSMVSCAHLVTRLLTLLSCYRREAGKVSPYILASYTARVQRTTLLPAVKRALVPGLYCVLDACDKFGVAHLFAALPLGLREIFRSLYGDYSKYHKFKGKI